MQIRTAEGKQWSKRIDNKKGSRPVSSRWKLVFLAVRIWFQPEPGVSGAGWTSTTGPGPRVQSESAATGRLATPGFPESQHLVFSCFARE